MKITPLLLCVLMVGCCSSERALLVVREGRVLLRHPAPGDPEWDARRLTFLDDANAVAPVETK